MSQAIVEMNASPHLLLQPHVQLTMSSSLVQTCIESAVQTGSLEHIARSAVLAASSKLETDAGQYQGLVGLWLDYMKPGCWHNPQIFGPCLNIWFLLHTWACRLLG